MVFYGHGFYIAQLGDRHGWSTSLVSTAVSVFYIVGVVSAIVVGRLIDRFNPLLMRAVVNGVWSLTPLLLFFAASMQAVYVPADDLTDPAATHIFAHLSASIVLSRKRASQGLYPAIDPLRSDSKMLTPGVVSERHYRVAQEVRRVLAEYDELKDIIAMLGIEELSRRDRETVARARRLERFLTQPFCTTEHFTGRPGRMVDLDDTLDGCERILAGDCDAVPERALYMIGRLEQRPPAAGEAAAHAAASAPSD